MSWTLPSRRGSCTRKFAPLPAGPAPPQLCIYRVGGLHPAPCSELGQRPLQVATSSWLHFVHSVSCGPAGEIAVRAVQHDGLH